MSLPEPPSLGRAAAGGAMWMGGSLVVQILIGIVAQVVLAGILTPRDFGVFALVVSLSLLFSSIGNFGIKTLMSQRTPDEIASLRPPVFRVGMLAAVLAAGLMAATSPVAAAVLDEPDLVRLLLITSAAFVLKPFTAITTALLQAHLRFAQVALAFLAAAVSHYVVAIVLARSGAGALSLVVGLQVNAVVMATVLWATSRHERRVRVASDISPRGAARMLAWPLAGEAAVDATGRLDFLMLGLFVRTEVVGVYYFGYQLVVRINELLTGVARNVLYPALAQIPDRPERQAAGVQRAAVLLTLGGGIVAAALVASLFPIEEILWGGRWEAAVPTMMLLATVAPGQAVQAAVEQLLKVRGRFRRWAGVITIRAVGGAVVALGVGLVLGEAADATDIAIAIAAFVTVEAIVEAIVVGRDLGLPVFRYWATTFPPWVILLGSGWAAAWLVSRLETRPWVGVMLGMGIVGVVGLLVVGAAWRAGHLDANRNEARA